MKNILAIPAAGKGSRLNSKLPKIFTPVYMGKSTFDIVINNLSSEIDLVVLLLSEEGKMIYLDLYKNSLDSRVKIIIQKSSTGMFDAINLIIKNIISFYDDFSIIFQWGDQPLINSNLHVSLLMDLKKYAASIPLVWVQNPYVQYKFGEGEVLVSEVREGELCDEYGFKDMGVFAYKSDFLINNWNHFSQIVKKGNITNEKNFIKFNAYIDFNKIFWRLDQPTYKSLGFNDYNDLNEIQFLLGQLSTTQKNYL
jgi:hypothetical protein